MKSQLIALYAATFGRVPESVLDLRADGSDRRLYRLTAPDRSTVVGVFGPDVEENRAFLSFSGSFRAVGLPVPLIHAVSEDERCYLEEDLGDTTLYDRLTATRVGREFPDEAIEIYERALELLIRVQIEGGMVVDYTVAYPYDEFDRRSMMWDLNYFKYHFLKLAGIPFNESRLERDFERLCDVLLRAERSHFLYRDFQSRNIMLRGNDLWLIDYQGGRRGALQYDVASLLYDAKADLPESLRERLLEHYLDVLAGYIDVDREEFVEGYRGFALIRILQAMGAYGYRGLFQRKPHFLASVPPAIANIERLLERGLAVDAPELQEALCRLTESDTLRNPIAHGNTVGESASGSASSAVPVTAPLTVYLRSFSYKRGYPLDESGHGGGFVFDCRALHNPGRHEEFKALCGLDQGVVEFLDRQEEVGPFWESVVTLVEGAVRTYRRRGFTGLSIAFGCTGGQHRSVYFAERLATYLREHHPGIIVDILHREKENWPQNHSLQV